MSAEAEDRITYLTNAMARWLEHQDVDSVEAFALGHMLLEASAKQGRLSVGMSAVIRDFLADCDALAVGMWGSA